MAWRGAAAAAERVYARGGLWQRSPSSSLGSSWLLPQWAPRQPGSGLFLIFARRTPSPGRQLATLGARPQPSTIQHVFSRRALTALRQLSVRSLQFFCLLNLISEHICEVSLCHGASMLPTLSINGEFVLHVRLPMYRLVARFLPDSVVGAEAHGIGKGGGDGTGTSASASASASDNQWASRNIGGPRGKLDPAMGTGLHVGDLIVATSPMDPQAIVCKRVIGLAGDTVLVDPRTEPSAGHSRTWHAGRTGDAPPFAHTKRLGAEIEQEDSDMAAFASSKGTKEAPLNTARRSPQYVVVPQGHIWVCGDNLGNSTDSRHYGPLPLSLVRGRAIARVRGKMLFVVSRQCEATRTKSASIADTPSLSLCSSSRHGSGSKIPCDLCHHREQANRRHLEPFPMCHDGL